MVTIAKNNVSPEIAQQLQTEIQVKQEAIKRSYIFFRNCLFLYICFIYVYCSVRKYNRNEYCIWKGVTCNGSNASESEASYDDVCENFSGCFNGVIATCRIGVWLSYSIFVRLDRFRKCLTIWYSNWLYEIRCKSYQHVSCLFHYGIFTLCDDVCCCWSCRI